MTDVTELAEVLHTLGPDALATMRDVVTLTLELGGDRGTAFLTECLTTLEESQTPRPASELLAPVLARWAEAVQS